MFIYLSKKIAIPNNTKLNTLAWNKDNGFIAVGGEGGLLKVLKLDGGTNQDAVPKSRGLAAASNLSMNQALEGHSGNIKVITWNESHKKLTTSDENGVIIVWMLYKGAWYEEMINNRKKSTVVGMCWSSDGAKICIIYEDGAVIVGSVDGNRIWGKELRNIQLSAVQWSPDGKLLIFGLHNGQVHLYDNLGNFAMKLDMQCLDPMVTEATIVGMDWYNGRFSYAHAPCPALAICYEDGRMQMMRDENDTSPILIDTGMTATSCSWNHNGSLIAVSGRQIDQDKQCNVVRFYGPFGDVFSSLTHLRTLKVPGAFISCCVWEGGSLRVALAVDSFVYFANIRPDYKWCYFKKTVVFTSCRSQKEGVCVSFWDTSNDQCHSKYVSALSAVAGYGDYCVLATYSDEEESKHGRGYGLLLCNTLGTPVDSVYVDIELGWLTMNATHAIAASKDNFIVWQYKTPKYSTVIGASRNRIRKYHIDDAPSGAVEVIQDLDQNIEIAVNTFASSDPICCLASSSKTLLIARESGLVQYYALPHVALYNRHKLSTRPHKMAINCNSTRLSVIDVAGVLTVIEMAEGGSKQNGARQSTTTENEKLERKDVWAMCWAADNPQLLAIMEKTRMYIFKGNNPEEPIASSGYLCGFQDLEVRALLLDEVMEAPDKPGADKLVKLEVKSLRDTRQLLEKVGVKEAAQFIEDNPHPRLWRLLAEAALRDMNLSTAESAFIRSNNYAGIAFVKKLRNISSASIRKAYIATYFKGFDEAEKLFFEADRRDLALAMRQTLGDWFRVIQIMKNSVSAAPDLILEVAYNSAADYFAQFNNWSAAVEYYALARNRGRLLECYYHLEDYEGIARIIDECPEGDSLLKQIGDMFSISGACGLAVEAYTKYGDHKGAIDLCVAHNKWDYAKELAKRYDVPEVFRLFSTHTVDLLDQRMLASAIEINVQIKNYHEAAQITFKLADEENRKTIKDAKQMKKIYVYGARLYEEFIKKKGSRSSLMAVENMWSGAEAYHLYLLVQEHLYAGRIRYAMQTAFQLLDYMEYIDAKDVYTLLALTSYLDGSYGICSKAFSQFSTIEGISKFELKQYEQLSLEIFEKHKAVDRRSVTVVCFNCQETIPDWSTTCPGCCVRFPICVVSGQSIIDDGLPVWICPDCRHYALKSQMTYRNKICPLCHISSSTLYDD